ncbi:MAG: toprim domain-containing protein [Ignavibacteria bacterium]
MSTHLKDKVEKIELTISKLVEESAKGNPIIVEGKKDAQTLRDLGVAGAVLTLKTGGKSFLEVTTEIEELGVKEVILLLDFDRRGREGIKRLQCDLERTKTKVNIKFWKELRALVGHEVQSIESLTNYLNTLQEKT